MQDFALCCLRVSEVHHLIQQLVNDDKVVPNTFLLQHLEVFGKNIHDLMKEKEDLGGICISFGQCKDVEVTVTDIEILDGRPFVSVNCMRTQKGDKGVGVPPRGGSWPESETNIDTFVGEAGRNS